MVDCDLTSQYAPADLTTEGSALATVGAFEFDGFRFDTTGWMVTELDYWFPYSCHALAWTSPSTTSSRRRSPCKRFPSPTSGRSAGRKPETAVFVNVGV
ncbi:hypothetical protein ACFWJT_27690 [Streptomyces sp. NPDC127069]|uniref:hypothetical protein n=1 Tax=Streptomyces sp. NPDC127069 TaxID=3347128 RepID=UPI003668F414